jgi:hypothetical protein
VEVGGVCGDGSGDVDCDVGCDAVVKVVILNIKKIYIKIKIT